MLTSAFFNQSELGSIMIEQKCINALEQGGSLVKNHQYIKAIKVYLYTLIDVQDNLESVMTPTVSRACWMIYSAMAELCSVKQQGTPEYIQQLYTSAFTLCHIAANNNNIQAKRDLGFMYYSGMGTAINYDKAIYWLESAASDPTPCDRTYCTLANIYKSLGDIQKAEFYFEKVQNFGTYIPPTPKEKLPARFPLLTKAFKKANIANEKTGLLDGNKENHFNHYGIN
jgi:tetratricopeptide (TPR) repeat protein